MSVSSRSSRSVGVATMLPSGSGGDRRFSIPCVEGPAASRRASIGLWATDKPQDFCRVFELKLVPGRGVVLFRTQQTKAGGSYTTHAMREWAMDHTGWFNTVACKLIGGAENWQALKEPILLGRGHLHSSHSVTDKSGDVLEAGRSTLTPPYGQEQRWDKDIVRTISFVPGKGMGKDGEGSLALQINSTTCLEN